jgi:hypothetical protein
MFAKRESGTRPLRYKDNVANSFIIFKRTQNSEVMLIQALFVAHEVTRVVVPILLLIVFGVVALLYTRDHLHELRLRARTERALASWAWEREKGGKARTVAERPWDLESHAHPP